MASVRIEPLVAECRIFYEDNPDPMADYQLSLNIVWVPGDRTSAYVTMHVSQKPHTRATLKALVKALLDIGITAVYASRKEGHVLPRAVLKDGYWVLDLLYVKERWKL